MRIVTSVPCPVMAVMSQISNNSSIIVIAEILLSGHTTHLSGLITVHCSVNPVSGSTCLNIFLSQDICLQLLDDHDIGYIDTYI